MSSKLEGSLGCLVLALWIGFALIQLGAGWAGIENAYGWGWGVAAAIAALYFRFTVPIVYGAFLCARDMWEWHWACALVFAMPGLLFMLPAVASSLFAVRGRRPAG